MKLHRILIAMMTTAVLAACGGKSEAPATDAAAAPTEKVYKVGMNAAFAPFESVDASGKLVGFEIDLTQAVADAAGIKVQFNNTPWEGIFASLENGDNDLLTSAVTITDKRKENMDFSEPYFEAEQLILVTRGQSISRVEDLQGKKIAVTTGTTADAVAQKLFGANSPNTKRFESLPLVLKEVESGGVDAAIGDNGVVANYVKNNSDKGFTTVRGADFDKEYYGMAVRKGDSALLAKLNAGIAKVKQDGTYDKLYEKYFGTKT